MFSTFTTRMRGTLLLLMAVFSLQTFAQSLPSKIEDGVILHCFNWKYNDIKNSLSQIKAAGFVAVQTSPAQLNVTNQDSWNILYRPRDSKAGPNVLGTSSELKALCDAAHALGIKVIVDVVANHTDGNLNWVADFWKNPDLYHNDGGANDRSRYQVTHGEIGMHDLKTEDSRVQDKFKAYVQELKGLGVDGIRWDAAKHIGLPSEGDQFWPQVIDNTMYNYGEILYTVGGGQDQTLLPEYMQYMSVTDSNYGTKTLLGSFKNGGVPSAGGGWSMWLNTNKLVYWGESHDTFCNNGDASYGVDQNKVDRAYAVAAAHNAIPSLYFSRPTGGNTSGPGCKAGVKGSTHFTSKEVAEVNKFHNAMVGKEDYYSSQNGACSTTRKGGGAVIVKGSGSGSVSVANGGGYAEAGTYTDRVSGGTFTVTASTISGNVGSSGIAVLWKDSQSSSGGSGDDPTPDPQPSGKTTVYVKASSAPHLYAWYMDGETAVELNGAWPGTQLTQQSDGYWLASFDAAPINIIFNDGVGGTVGVNQTENIEDISGDNYFTYDGAGSYTTESTPTPTPDPQPQPGSVTVYFKNTQGWSSVNCYAYIEDGSKNGEWPGAAMTYDADITVNGSKGWWKYTLPSGMENSKVVFNGDGNQYPATMEPGLAVGGSSMACDGTDWSAATVGGGDDPTPQPGGKTTIYVKSATAPYLYVWAYGQPGLNGAWPGNQMTQKEGDYWVASFDKAPVSIIFNDGTAEGGVVGVNQTENIEDISGDNYFTYDGGGNYTKEGSTSIDSVPTVEFQTNNIYTIDGRRIRQNATSLQDLKPGVYIVGGKKIVKY